MVKFIVRSVVLIISSIANSKIFPCEAFFLCFWRNVYWSVLFPQNLPCLGKFLVGHLHREITLKSMSQTKEKYNSLVLSRSYSWMVWRCHGIQRVYCYNFCLKPTFTKDSWMRTTSFTIMLIFLKVEFWKLLGYSYAQSSFSTIRKHIEHSILKHTQQLNNFQTWINICAKSLIKNSVNMMKQKLMEVPGKRWVAQKSKRALWRTLQLNRPAFDYFIYARLFSQT